MLDKDFTLSEDTELEVMVAIIDKIREIDSALIYDNIHSDNIGYNNTLIWLSDENKIDIICNSKYNENVIDSTMFMKNFGFKIETKIIVNFSKLDF